MINLLPDQEKTEINAARTNVILIKLIVLISAAMIFLSIFCASTYTSLNSTKKVAENTIKAANANQINGPYEIGAIIATTESIFSRQINYSDVIMTIGSNLPNGVSANVLSLNENILSKPFYIELKSNSNIKIRSATTNLQNSSMFSNSNFNNQVTPITDQGYIVKYTLQINKALNL